jgi:hypothetical protein
MTDSTERYTIALPAIPYSSANASNPVEITLSIQPTEHGPRVSLQGLIWQRSRRDIESGGQNQDTLRRFYPTDARVQRLCDLWDRWHLNDMRAGTPAQEAAIRTWRAALPDPRRDYDYGAACDYLKSLNLYDDQGYKYGHAWLFEPVPAEVLAELRAIFTNREA